jgi:hypothetical protein
MAPLSQSWVILYLSELRAVANSKVFAKSSSRYAHFCVAMMAIQMLKKAKYSTVTLVKFVGINAQFPNLFSTTSRTQRLFDHRKPMFLQ